jgi:hypothetical protein
MQEPKSIEKPASQAVALRGYKIMIKLPKNVRYARVMDTDYPSTQAHGVWLKKI